MQDKTAQTKSTSKRLKLTVSQCKVGTKQMAIQWGTMGGLFVPGQIALQTCRDQFPPEAIQSLIRR